MPLFTQRKSWQQQVEFKIVFTNKEFRLTQNKCVQASKAKVYIFLTIIIINISSINTCISSSISQDEMYLVFSNLKTS